MNVGPPPPFGRSMADALRLTRGDLVATAADGGGAKVKQFGAAYLPDTVALPEVPADRTMAEPLIETFVCGRDGSVEPTGSDPALIDLWRPSVTGFAAIVFAALRGHDVPVASTAYVTASFTPAAELAGIGHFDDDQYLPDAGVGVVAIVGSDSGSRVAVQDLELGPAVAGMPLHADQAVFDAFTDGTIQHQRAAADQIIVFPQFGQLHSGPPFESSDAGTVRRLLVLRADTDTGC